LDGAPGAGDLWGKFRDAERGGPAWHPLIDHCIDVAGVLEALLRQPTVRRRLARAAGLDDIDEGLIARLAFLAFIHDLGKCAPGFQAKASVERRGTVGHLSALKPLWCEGDLWLDFSRALAELGLGQWGDEVLQDYLEAVFSHHGNKPDLGFSRGSDQHLVETWRAKEGEPLRRLQEFLAVGRVQFPDGFRAAAGELPAAPSFQHLFAGLLMLADWIGSNADWFRFTEPADPPRLAFVREHAAQIVKRIGFVPPELPRPLLSFARQFDGYAPRPAQTALDGLPLPDESGSVVLLESETGSGKTEAAFRWASRLIDAGLVDGCYFAVPLRSAAVQLYGRMRRWLLATYGDAAPEPLLAVPGYFRMGDAEGTRLPDLRVQWSDLETEDRRTERWAAEQPKRYMATGFAVGTIDQALLGALAVKHAHLRAACLVRHLLVIDEVHSSDAYMTTLAERLMTLFRASGGHVLLMSATVGAGTRERLVHGRKAAPALDAAIATAYPRITPSHADPVDVADEGPGKTVAIEPMPLIDRPEAVAALAAEAVGTGARVLVLRNTVTAAIATQQALELLLPAEHEAFFRVGDIRTLHHGRFAAEDRRLLDAAVEGRFGKRAGSGPALIVATQTLEQSLDVDADFLITDLAPVDVLLQRIGRLHRHERKDRPKGFRAARCVVLLPEAADLTSFLHRARHGIGPERAYDNVLSVEATRQMVAEAPRWTIPADNRRLVEEGTHEERLRGLADQLGSAWDAYWKRYRGLAIALRSQGKDASIDYSKRFSETEWPLAAEKLATRLGAHDLLLSLEPALASPFGQKLERLRLPRWMAPKELPAEIPSAIVSGDFFQFEGSAYRYDRFGLQLIERQ